MRRWTEQEIYFFCYANSTMGLMAATVFWLARQMF
jgi:hypothetical protein